MRTKNGKTIVCISALSLFVCAGAVLKAEPLPSASQNAGSAVQDSMNDLSVSVGKTVLVDTQWPITRVAVGLGDIAEVHATSPTEIMVNGKTPGETSLILWDTHGGRQFFNVTVRPSVSVLDDELEGIRRELRTELPGQTLKVSSEDGTIFLRGTVNSLGDSARAVKIASVAGKVVNLLDVEVPPSDPQILLKVRFCSIDLEREKQLGINLFNNGLGNSYGAISTGQFTPPLTTQTGTTISSDQNLMAYLPGLGGFGATIQALETKGIVDILAEPNVLTSNGKQASFLAGGQYPYPVVQGGAAGTAASVTIMFQEYGVRLNFIPTITPRGTIRLQVAPEVSALDYTNEVEIAGFVIPGITERRMRTEVELKDGQSLVLGGLLDHRDTETFEKVPFLGDIPILGKFFQSMLTNKTNTELIVIVTPEIVAPIPNGAPLPHLKYPGKFMPDISGIPMHNPDAKTAATTLPSSPSAIPVEKLVDSMKTEKPLVIEGVTGFGGGSSSSVGSSSTTSSSPQY
ncbi:MAG: type II and III secretion system protein family protein [Terracidiphilus sp.]